MPDVMNLGVPSWGSLTRERLIDSDGILRDDFLIPVPNGDNADDYFTLEEYAQFAWYFPSTVFFFSEGRFTYRIFSLVVKPMGYIGAIDDVVQKFVSSVHDNSLLPKSDKATKLARELKPLRNILDSLDFPDVQGSRVLLAYIIANPVCPTLESFEPFTKFALEAKQNGSIATLNKAIADIPDL